MRNTIPHVNIPTIITFFLTLISMAMSEGGQNDEYHHSTIRENGRERRRLTAQKRDQQQLSDAPQIERKAIWIPRVSTDSSKSKWDLEYKKGFWDTLAIVPVERTRAVYISGVIFQKYFGDTGRMLDVGGGEGVMSDYLREEQKSRYTCVDLSEEGVKIGRKRRPKATFYASFAEDFNKDKTMKFDLIVFSEVLYYCDHKALINQYLEYLNPGGLIAVSVWSRKGHVSEKMSKGVNADLNDLMELVESVSIAGETLVGFDPSVTNVKPPTKFFVSIFQKKTESIMSSTRSNTDINKLGMGGQTDEFLSHVRLSSGIIAGTYHQAYFKGNGTILDVGCGEGWMADQLPSSQRHRYTGVDSSSAAISRARTQHPGSTFTVADPAQYNVDGRLKYDMIVFNEGVICGPQALTTIKRYVQYLNPGGAIALSVWRQKRDCVADIGRVLTELHSSMEVLDSQNIRGKIASRSPGTASKPFRYAVSIVRPK